MTSSIQEKIQKLNVSLKYDSIEFYKNIILGQQVYRVMLYTYLFMTVSQDSKICENLIRRIPKEKLLKLYLYEINANDIWTSETDGILHKVRRSFAILGMHYQTFGYDSVYTTFKSAVEPFFDEFLLNPITDNTHVFETCARLYYHEKISYNVEEIQKFSDRDILFQASTVFLGIKYSEIGYSERNAIENLAFKVANTAIPKRKFLAIAKSQHYIKIRRDAFAFDTSEYKETDDVVSQFADKYGIEPFLMRLALLSRSQMGDNIWNQLGIILPECLKKIKVSRIKKALTSFGQEIILLQLFDFSLIKNSLKRIDFRLLDQTIINMGLEEIHDQLLKVLRTTDITEELFNVLNPPVKGSLPKKEKGQIINSLMAVFFLSNFAPDKKFIQYFSEYIAEAYKKISTTNNIDYRFLTLSFLSVLHIKTKTNHHELGNGIFHAEIILGDGQDAPIYICENESMRTAKKDVWKEAYDDIIVQLRHFFISPNANCTKAALLLFMQRVQCVNITDNDFYLDFGILNARNFSNLNYNVVSKIISRLSSLVSGSIIDGFLKVIYTVNRDLYIEIGGVIYTYSSWLKSIVLNKKDATPVEASGRKIVEIYKHIVNPSLSTQKKLIDINYKLVNRIYPLSDEIAKYAIEKNPDAYNYLQFISAETALFYEELKRKEERLSDIGALALNLDSDTSIMILDSHKPFHNQIENLVEELNVKRVTIACGYCFVSGLSLFKELISHTLFKGIPLELHVGALQKYDDAEHDNMITGIDKKTVKCLNTFLTNANFSLFTCPDRFYHGKLYIFEGSENSIICMGSSNVSRAAFITNYELNIAFKTKTVSELFNKFVLWVNQLRFYSKEIKHLDEAMFGENEIKQDGSIHLTRISLSSMQSKINELSNIEVQYRLNLWMSYSPDLITENLGIPSLPDYFVFVYAKEHMVVLESFQAGNAYFCIRYKNSFEDTINHIATFSKTEIFEYSQMSKRGYHVQNKFTLENNIKSYFKMRWQNEHEK